MQRSRPGSEVATWSALVGQKWRRDLQRSRLGSEVATWSALVRQKRRRDMDLMSRHGRQCGRSRHGNDVAT